MKHKVKNPLKKYKKLHIKWVKNGKTSYKKRKKKFHNYFDNGNKKKNEEICKTTTRFEHNNSFLYYNTFKNAYL